MVERRDVRWPHPPEIPSCREPDWRSLFERERARAESAEARCEELRWAEVDSRARAGSLKWRLDTCRDKLEAGRNHPGTWTLRQVHETRPTEKGYLAPPPQKKLETNPQQLNQPPITAHMNAYPVGALRSFQRPAPNSLPRVMHPADQRGCGSWAGGVGRRPRPFEPQPWSNDT